VLWKDGCRLLLLLLDECSFMKELHFRAPLFEAALSHIKVYDQYAGIQFKISFNTEQDIDK
jgi:hypothetical protein